MGLETDWEPACLNERGGCGERRAGILAGLAPSRCMARGRAPHPARQAGAAWLSQGWAGERALTRAHFISRASFPAVLMLLNELILHRQGSRTQYPHACVWKVLLRSLI